MTHGLSHELITWNAECRRAKFHWRELRDTTLEEVYAQISRKERNHLLHSAFRINALMYLYARLRRQQHSTQLGMLCGVITHLLDYFYDQCSPSDEQIACIEKVVHLEAEPSPDSLLERTLYKLFVRFWAIVPDPKSIKCMLARMLATQKDTLLQVDDHRVISEEALVKLTGAKGHRSVCLYFSIANPDFSAEEAEHLVSFGYYMQYMDDLEDFYEDLSEHRVSSIRSVADGCRQAARLLDVAEPDLAPFYNRDNYDYRFFWNTAQQYQRIILYACRRRERIRRLPRLIQKVSRLRREFFCALLPLIYLTPVEWYE